MSIELEPIEIFYSYAHEDEALRDSLEKHLRILKRQGYITSWHDRMVSAGREWAGEIDMHLNSAQIILLLISPDFMDSDYCYDTEMKRALERHHEGDARIIPIILRPVYWENAPFSKLQVLPKDGKAVITWPIRDEAFENITQGIVQVVKELILRSPTPILYGNKSTTFNSSNALSFKDQNRSKVFSFQGQLKDEEVRIIIRKHYSFLLISGLPLLGSILLLFAIVLASFFWHFLGLLEYLSFGVVFLLIIVTSFKLFRSIIAWYKKYYIVTTKRIISSSDSLGSSQKFILLKDIQQIGISVRSILEAIQEYGDVHIYVTGGDFIMSGVSHPRIIRDVILSLWQKTKELS